MPHHDDEMRFQMFDGVLDASCRSHLDDVSGNARDEQTAQALVKYDFCRHAAVGTAQHHGERRLSEYLRAALGCREFGAPRLPAEKAGIPSF